MCSRVSWTFGLGHDAHAHPLSQGTGCQFAIPTPADATQHGETENIFGVVVITYTDNGANGLPGATTTEQLILNPKKQEAEWADASQGVEITGDDTASGLRKVTSFDAGDWLAWDPANLVGVTGVSARATGTGTLSLRWDSPTAAPFGTIAVNGSGWTDAAATLSSKPTGTGRLYVTSMGGVVLDSLTFVGNGVADVTPPTVSVTLNPATPNGTNGWYTSNVTVTVNATDDGTVASRQRSTDGGATWVNANTALTVSAEGTTTVLYRATDNGGNVSQVGSVTIKLDKTAPTVAVSGVAEGASVGNSGDLTWTATDATSGIDTVTATVDGAAVAADKPLALWRLPLGSHTLVVKATDKAGLVTTTTRTFTTTTSVLTLTALTEQLAREGLVTPAGERELEKRLQQAEKHIAGGRTGAAISQLEGFIEATKSTSYVRDAAAAAALARDANAVIASLR